MTTSITRVGVVAKHHLQPAVKILVTLAAWLEKRGIKVIYDVDTAQLADNQKLHHVATREELPKLVDLIVVLGGDGTLLSMAGRIAEADQNIPILGVNFGSLGFLTEIRIDELYSSLESVLTGTASFDERLMLKAEAHRTDMQVETRIVLNDVVFTKTAVSRIINLSVSVSDAFVTKVKADGLIVASPTGSTAYNLAAGGPIVHPVVDALVLTPIAPHTLTHRPIVIPSSEIVDVRPHLHVNDEVFVTYDGQSGYPIQDGDFIRISSENRTLRLVQAPTRDFFEVLREKLNWGKH